MESEAWHWLPDFARVAVLYLASSYTSKNNGGLELSDKRAKELGITAQKKNLGLDLACHVGIIDLTCPAKQFPGKGRPAKYSISWKAIDEIPALNLTESTKARNRWMNAKVPEDDVWSIRKAATFLNRYTQSCPGMTKTLEGQQHVHGEKVPTKRTRVSRKAKPRNTRVKQRN